MHPHSGFPSEGIYGVFRGDGYLWWQVAELGFDAFMVRMRSRAS